MTAPGTGGPAEDAQMRGGLLALYDEIVGPQNDDDLDEYLAEKRDDPEFVVAYIRAHIAALSAAATAVGQVREP